MKDKKDSFGTYLGEPSAEQLNQFFYLHEKDLEIISTMRLSSTKLGFSLQLSSLRFLGTFCTDINTIPENAIIYVAAQLKINPKGVPSAYEEFVSIRNRFKNFAVILYI
ncbi:DUF4158 domain-containing protein [Enterococcus faecalis]|nr:DUF4158 domain-containing protein [Enterococcus faecalis]EIW9709290.1 DUF4158 domain-containing protein [Enterococcus faecalis]